jgi:hypothetical protein
MILTVSWLIMFMLGGRFELAEKCLGGWGRHERAVFLNSTGSRFLEFSRVAL